MSSKRKALLVAKLCLCLAAGSALYLQSTSLSAKVADTANAACPSGCFLLNHICVC